MSTHHTEEEASKPDESCTEAMGQQGLDPAIQEIRDSEHRHEKMSYNQITDLIYAGNNFCCQGHFSQELLSKGIAADISLEAERVDDPQGVKYFYWYPWEEDAAPTIELIHLALDTLEGLIKKNIKTYIHCKNGHGRTTTFLSSYFIRAHNLSARDALKMVVSKRPSGHINPIQDAFLKDFAQSIRGGRFSPRGTVPLGGTVLSRGKADKHG